MWKAVDLKTKMRVADAENYQTGPALGPSTKTAYNCIRMIQHGILNQQTIQNSSEPGLSYFSQLAKACWYQISRKKYITKKSPKELIKLAQNAIDARSQDRNSAENGNPESQILNLHQLFFVLFFVVVVHLSILFIEWWYLSGYSCPVLAYLFQVMILSISYWALTDCWLFTALKKTRPEAKKTSQCWRPPDRWV